VKFVNPSVIGGPIFNGKGRLWFDGNGLGNDQQSSYWLLAGEPSNGGAQRW